MKLLRGSPVDPLEARLLRTIAFAVVGVVAVAALYFGRDVLLPTAVAILLAFILSPAITWLRRLVPYSLSVAAVVVVALAIFGLLAVLVMTQLADAAGNLTGYQTNLQQKVKDLHALADSGGPLTRFASMVASLASDFARDGTKIESLVPAAVPAGASSYATVASFAVPLLRPLLTIGIVLIIVIFILLDRDHISDQVVRLFGGSNVHATSEALEDAAGRVARVLLLQVLMNLGFSVAVGGGLFLLDMPNPILWGLLAGALRFVPYVGAVLGAVLPTLIAFAVSPGWVQPFLVLGFIVACDIVLGHFLEPLIFGESTGVTPLALILSALFWSSLWGPIGLILSTPITICLLVLGRHVPNLGFLQVLLGDEPALKPYQQIYRRLMRKAVPEASAVAQAEIDEKGRELGLDDSLGRMLVLAEQDRASDRLSPEQIDAIVEGTDLVLDFLDDRPDESATPTPAPRPAPRAFIRCIGGRSQIDDAAAAVLAFALRQDGMDAASAKRGESTAAEPEAAFTLTLICYASHPSEAVRRYTSRKLRGGASASVRHAIVDYDAAGPHPPGNALREGPDIFVGDVAAICRLAAQVVSAVSTLDQELAAQG
ncbi:AI-2E family transporter [Reyranella sp.]|uniref:AI-2E family transporter n=1 Tax=Reyranella sp. TaxID=1929291 RepID=UPI00272F92E0|nr:AI-2E family transporter [Reyranella sp.]MDP2376295.1 AI-2E family transporter [Reyranella sp.]